MISRRRVTNAGLATCFNWLFCLAALCIAMLFVWFGLLQWPGLHWDACYFATPVINLASGRGWVFGGVADPIVLSDTRDYVAHGVVHVLIFGGLLKADTWERYFALCGTANGLTFLAWTFLFDRTLNRVGSGSYRRINAILSGLIAGVIAIGLQGRPEHLAPLLISCPLLLREFGLSARLFELAMYGLGGVLLMLSPASGLVMAIGAGFWISYRYENDDSRRFYGSLLTAAFVACVSAFLVSLLCPFSIFTWFSRLVTVQGNTPIFADRLFRLNWKGVSGISMDAPFWNVFILSTTWLVGSILFRRKKWVGFAVCSILAIYLWPKLTDYGYVSFIPLILIYLISRPSSSLFAIARPGGTLAVARIQTILGTLYALTFVRTALLALIYMQTGTKFATTREKLVSLGADEWREKNIATVFHGWSRPSFIVFGDGGERFLIGTPAFRDGPRDQGLIDYTQKFHRRVEYFIYPQIHAGSPERELFIGSERCQLIYDGWVADRPMFLGVDLGCPRPGYQFALYKRVDTAQFCHGMFFFRALPQNLRGNLQLNGGRFDGKGRAVADCRRIVAGLTRKCGAMESSSE